VKLKLFTVNRFHLSAFVYQIFIRCFIGLAFIYSLFSKKGKAFFQGRRKIFTRLRQALANNKSPIIWFHFASLGEFEQGRPVLEKLKAQNPTHKVLITFFSPSGYEVRKNYAMADWVFYLPYDLPKYARLWVLLVKPVMVVFVKYEFWPNFLFELKKKNIPSISVSSIFRPEQMFFQSYGAFMRRALQTFNHFFVQNDRSARLLSSIGIKNVTVSGDTRFDRVYQITKSSDDIEIALKFKAGQKCFVVGSCWGEDLEVLAHFINAEAGRLKFIIAPHEISESFIQEIQRSVEVISVRFSQSDSDWESASVLIVDNMGMLSRLYRYGEFAYVGGAFGKGLHNILEAACYGVPVFFGDKSYERFQEAVDLIDQGGAFAVSGFVDLKTQYETLMHMPENYQVACNASKNYVEINLGATDKIVKYCQQLLSHEGKSN
jgi:3-deoxy-D-manno-octulosonic-acid transferase